MKGRMLVRTLVEELGRDAEDALSDFGVDLDDWDLDLTISELCSEYGLELPEIMGRMRVIRDTLEDAENEEDDLDYDDVGDDDLRDDLDDDDDDVDGDDDDVDDDDDDDDVDDDDDYDLELNPSPGRRVNRMW